MIGFGNENIYTLVIEWDGQRPPTQWYNRLKELVANESGRSVRGKNDKGVTAIENRLGDTSGVVVQEGCIISSSESLIGVLAQYAKTEMGAKLEANGGRPPTVLIIKGEMKPELLKDSGTKALVKKLNQKLGKRGPKPPEREWVVTCLECVSSHNVSLSRVVTCPNCSSARFHIRLGEISPFRDDPSVPVFEYWARCRFGSRAVHAEFAPILDSELYPFAPELNDDGRRVAREWSAYERMRGSKLSSTLDGIQRIDAFEILDACLMSLSHYPKRVREQARITCISNIMVDCLEHEDPDIPIFTFPEIEIDILTASHLWGEGKTAKYILSNKELVR